MISPSSPESAERSVLGGILLDNRRYAEAAERLKPEHFYLDAHRRIYKHMIALAESARPIDMITLTEALDRAKELETVGDVAYVSGLIDGVPERSIKHYVDIVHEHALQHGLTRRLQLLQDDLSANGLQDAESGLESLVQFVRDGRANEWHSLFHSYDDVTQAPPARFAIEGFLQEE